MVAVKHASFCGDINTETEGQTWQYIFFAGLRRTKGYMGTVQRKLINIIFLLSRTFFQWKKMSGRLIIWARKTAVAEQPSGWRESDDVWRVTDGGWRVTDGGWRVTDGGLGGGGGVNRRQLEGVRWRWGGGGRQ